MDNLHIMITPREMKLVQGFAASIFREHCLDGEDGSHAKEDLIHHGIVGLLEAKREFDESQGIPWLASAAFKLQEIMMDHVERSAMVRLPNEKRQLAAALKKAENRLLKTAGKVDPVDLARELGWPLEKVHGVMNLSPSIVRLDKDGRVLNGRGRVLNSLLNGSGLSPEKRFLRNELAEIMDFCLNAIDSSKNRLVLLSRFIHGLKMRELTRRLNCTLENARQRLTSAMNQVKNCLEGRGWTEALDQP